MNDWFDAARQQVQRGGGMFDRTPFRPSLDGLLAQAQTPPAATPPADDFVGPPWPFPDATADPLGAALTKARRAPAGQVEERPSLAALAPKQPEAGTSIAIKGELDRDAQTGQWRVGAPHPKYPEYVWGGKGTGWVKKTDVGTVR